MQFIPRKHKSLTRRRHAASHQSPPLKRRRVDAAKELSHQVRQARCREELWLTPSFLRIPLNDDSEERAERLQVRQAEHDRQMNQIKAAVKTPLPPRRTHDRAGSQSPSTPRASLRGRESDVDGRGRGATPKRVPILANFEEWMKMATDNKINASNSWNFALIDYFHDMSLLREGDGVNFQKASCTLDGCVKIYTSRVDSVATETGKLLSGLAESRDRSRHQEAEESGEADEEEEEGEDGERRKTKKKVEHRFNFSRGALHSTSTDTCSHNDRTKRHWSRRLHRSS